MLRLSCPHVASIGAALAVALLSLTVANAESAPDNTPLSYWATEFAKTVRDDTAILDQSEWRDFSALGYASSGRSDAAGVRWPPQPLPAVDGINGKIAGFGGGADYTDGFYGTTGSLRFRLRSSGARKSTVQLEVRKVSARSAA